VLSFYTAQNLVFCGAFRDGPWSALLLNKPLSPWGRGRRAASKARQGRAG
jgi:hypothetical protein